MILEPAVNVSKVAVSALSAPVIVSPDSKSVLLIGTKVTGEIVLTTRAFAPDVQPVISSPCVKLPLEPVIVHCGRTGSAVASSESKTAHNL